MACPTCDATMELLGSPLSAIRKDWWCPRCGTLLTEQVVGLVVHKDTAVPKLVERCRAFATQEYAAYSPEKGRGVIESPPRWVTLGIAESINVPADRPE